MNPCQGSHSEACSHPFFKERDSSVMLSLEHFLSTTGEVRGRDLTTCFFLFFQSFPGYFYLCIEKINAVSNFIVK